MMKSTEMKIIYKGAVGIRRVLAIPQQAPIDEVVEDENSIDLLLKHASSENYSLQYECIWSLCNIASGTSQHTEVSSHLNLW